MDRNAAEIGSYKSRSQRSKVGDFLMVYPPRTAGRELQVTGSAFEPTSGTAPLTRSG
jgi:hypothetical protein